MFAIEKTCTITHYDGEGGDLNIPEYIDDCRVVAIKCGLFENKKFNDIILPASLIQMENVFMTTEITGKLILNAPIISPSAFWMSTISSELILPECLTHIGEFAFFGSSLIGKLVIPKNVLLIDEGAFAKCCGITSIEFAIGSKIRKISKYAFAGCENLSCDIKFPDSLLEICDKAFFATNVNATGHTHTYVHKSAFEIAF